ncbi:hypothetical protein C8R46DRAFT_1222547 [Mycena filopes]|nr:hypothetical protein C8R46DRAFT_1222547 [Mycena filopes]
MRPVVFTFDDNEYFRHSAYRDPVLIRASVILAFFLDSLSTSATDGIVYLTTVTHWGDLGYYDVEALLIPIFILLTGVSGLVSRVYLGYRYWRITKHQTFMAIFVALNLASIGGLALLSVTALRNATFDARFALRVPAIFWMASSAAADIFIALLLLVCSRHGISSFPRFCSAALQTGLVGALFSLATFVVFLVDTEQTSLSFAVLISLGRVYSHAVVSPPSTPTPPSTQLRNLNSRRPPSIDALGPMASHSIPHLTTYAFSLDTAHHHNSGMTTTTTASNSARTRPIISAPLPVGEPNPDPDPTPTMNTNTNRLGRFHEELRWGLGTRYEESVGEKGGSFLE